MSESEAAEFEQAEDYQLFVAIRRWDDQAKDPLIPVPSLDKYKYLIQKHLIKKSI
jgi:predicted HD phosphohydrolase